MGKNKKIKPCNDDVDVFFFFLLLGRIKTEKVDCFIVKTITSV